jgi:ABC-2 type transport system permease protein
METKDNHAGIQMNAETRTPSPGERNEFGGRSGSEVESRSTPPYPTPKEPGQPGSFPNDCGRAGPEAPKDPGSSCLGDPTGWNPWAFAPNRVAQSEDDYLGLAAAWALSERELLRFFRQRSRLIGAFGQPLVFWILFGAGFRSSFRLADRADLPFSEYFYPGVLVMIVLFTAIFASMSVIDDRHHGFLQGVLVAPIGRSTITLGKVLGGALIALVQAGMFLVLAPLAGIDLSVVRVLAAVALLFVLAIALVSLGLCLAWRIDSTQGFHAVMSIVLTPMWLLSGAFFPAHGGPVWLEWIVRLNPITYAVAALRHLLYWGDGRQTMWAELPGLGVSILVTLVFTVAMFALATSLVGRQSAEGT